jgi:hypothetical protein
MRRQVKEWRQAQISDERAKPILYAAFVDGKLRSTKHSSLRSPPVVRIFAPGAEVGSIAQEHCDAEKPPWGGGFVSFGSTCSAVSATNLYGQGFGEFEAEGGLGGQDDLLGPGGCSSCGSRTGTHC